MTGRLPSIRGMLHRPQQRGVRFQRVKVICPTTLVRLLSLDQGVNCGLSPSSPIRHAAKMSKSKIVLRHKTRSLVSASFHDTIRQWIHRVFSCPFLSSYTRDTSAPAIGLAYMMLEHIGPEIGQMLSLTWETHKNNSQRRTRLYQGMTPLIISLARRLDPVDGTVTLTNRPLTCTGMILENEGASKAIRPSQMYQTIDSFASDMLMLHDNHFLQHPHAALDEDDARDCTTIRTLLRTVTHHFILPDWRDGPFLMQLDDFH